MYSLGLSDAQLRGVATFINEIYDCRTCKGKRGCASHAPGMVERRTIDSVYTKVPLVSKNGTVMLHGYFYPITTVLRLLLQERVVVDSLLFEEDERVPFTCGIAFRWACRELQGASPPLMISLFTDAAVVVRIGQRSLWAVYMRVLNSTLTPSSTARFVGLIPVLRAEMFPHMGADKLHGLRLATYQSMMAAICHSGYLYRDQPDLHVLTYQGVRAFRVCLQMFQADSKDHTKASGLLDKTCPRCEGDGKVVSFADRSAGFGKQARRALAAGEQPAKMQRQLHANLRQEHRTHLVRNFSLGVTCFDLAHHSAICILHLNDVGWTKKLFKWTGRALASWANSDGRAGQQSRRRQQTRIREVCRQCFSWSCAEIHAVQ